MCYRTFHTLMHKRILISDSKILQKYKIQTAKVRKSVIRRKTPQDVTDRRKTPQDVTDRSKTSQDVTDRRKTSQTAARRHRTSQTAA